MKQQFSIGARPTLLLLFATEEGAILTVNPDLSVVETPDEELTTYRCEYASNLTNNPDYKEALAAAVAYAGPKGMTVTDEFVYFD